MRLQLLHDCRLSGHTVRHRTPIDYREVKLNSGHLRLEGTRCDGTPIEKAFWRSKQWTDPERRRATRLLITATTLRTEVLP